MGNPEHFLFMKDKTLSHNLQIRYFDMCPLIVFWFFFKGGELRTRVDIPPVLLLEK